MIKLKNFCVLVLAVQFLFSTASVVALNDPAGEMPTESQQAETPLSDENSTDTTDEPSDTNSPEDPDNPLGPPEESDSDYPPKPTSPQDGVGGHYEKEETTKTETVMEKREVVDEEALAKLLKKLNDAIASERRAKTKAENALKASEARVKKAEDNLVAATKKAEEMIPKIEKAELEKAGYEDDLKAENENRDRLKIIETGYADGLRFTQNRIAEINRLLANVTVETNPRLIASLEAERTELQRRIPSYKEALKGTRADLRKSEARIRSLTAKIKSAETRIANLKKQYEQLLKKAEQLGVVLEQVRAKETPIQDGARKTIASADAKIKDYEAQIKNLDIDENKPKKTIEVPVEKTITVRGWRWVPDSEATGGGPDSEGVPPPVTIPPPPVLPPGPGSSTPPASVPTTMPTTYGQIQQLLEQKCRPLNNQDESQINCAFTMQPLYFWTKIRPF